jgi:hypothetical protein
MVINLLSGYRLRIRSENGGRRSKLKDGCPGKISF